MSANKAKGTKWEVAVRDYLNAHDIPAFRPAQEGFRDTGDLHGVAFFAIQCKDWRDVTGAVREGTDGVQRQKKNAKRPYGVNFVKRARKGTSQGYAVMTIEDWTAFYLEYLNLVIDRDIKDKP